MQNYLGGPAEVAINQNLIPAIYLSEVSVDYSEGTRDTTTLGGKLTQPTGMIDKATVKFTVFLPNMSYLGVLFPDIFNAGTGVRSGKGNVIINTNGCMEITSTPVNVHYTCDGADDSNDILIYNGRVQVSMPITFNDKDSVSVDVMVYAQPDDDGNVMRFGIGDLSGVSYYDHTTMQTVVS